MTTLDTLTTPARPLASAVTRAESLRAELAPDAVRFAAMRRDHQARLDTVGLPRTDLRGLPQVAPKRRRLRRAG